MNRRDFVVRSTGAVAALSVAAFAAEPSAGATEEVIPACRPHRVIFDERFQESCAFGARATLLGCPVQSISGDVTELWAQELQPSWARGEGAVVGMTTGASLMCLEQLAWNHWMRVVARIDHRGQPDGTVRHRLVLPGIALRGAQLALAQHGRWAELLVAPMVRTLGVHARAIERIAVTRDPSGAGSQLALTSWVIEARRRPGAPSRAETGLRSEAAAT